MLKGFIKKRLTSEAPASLGDRIGDRSAVSVDDVSRCAARLPTAPSPPRSAKRSRSTDNVVKPVTSLTSTVFFVRRFLPWCVNVGVTGPTDWPRVYALAFEFADYANLRPPSERALARCLTQLGIGKSVREMKASERGIVSVRRSKAGRCRVTVYHLPSTIIGHLASSDDQLDLFD